MLLCSLPEETNCGGPSYLGGVRRMGIHMVREGEKPQRVLQHEKEQPLCSNIKI